MPRVPRYGDRQVDAQAIPGVRTSTDVDLESFGGGESLAQVNRAAGQLTDTAFDFAIKAREQADEVKVNEADLQYGLLQSRIEGEVRKMGGSNAAGAKDYADTEWNTGLEKINADLKMSPRQQSLAQKKVGARYLQINDSVNSHMAGEFQKHDKLTMESKILNARKDAALNAGNPDRLNAAIAQQEEAFIGWANRNGLDKESVKAGLDEIKSETHASVIESFISNGDFAKAREYYKGSKKELSAKYLDKNFSQYIDSKERAAKELAEYEIKQRHEKGAEQLLTDEINGNLNYLELVRRRQNDEISDSDYKEQLNRMKSDDYKYLRDDAGGTAGFAAFNRIREAQLSGQYSQGQIARMIMREKDLRKEEVSYLGSQKVSEANSPKDRRITVQSAYVRSFAERYLKKSGFDFFGKKKAETDAEVEEIVSEFYRRVDKDNPNEEGIDKIALDLVSERVKRDYPGITNLEDLPHNVATIEGKFRNLFTSSDKKNVKARYTLTRNQIKEAKEKNKK